MTATIGIILSFVAIISAAMFGMCLEGADSVNEKTKAQARLASLLFFFAALLFWLCGVVLIW